MGRHTVNQTVSRYKDNYEMVKRATLHASKERREELLRLVPSIGGRIGLITAKHFVDGDVDYINRLIAHYREELHKTIIEMRNGGVGEGLQSHVSRRWHYRNYTNQAVLLQDLLRTLGDPKMSVNIKDIYEEQGKITGMKNQNRLENWSITMDEVGKFRLEGFIFDDFRGKHSDNHPWMSSPIEEVNFQLGLVRTEGRVYKLGKQAI